MGEIFPNKKNRNLSRFGSFFWNYDASNAITMHITDEALENVVGGGGDYYPEIPYYTEGQILRMIAEYNRYPEALDYVISNVRRSNSNINRDVNEAYFRARYIADSRYF